MSTIHEEAHVLLRFFSRMNAHISHDLKNALATATETAGLLEDMMDLYREADKPDWDRLVKLCRRISDQSRRAGELCNRFNTFSHCGDELVGDVDLDHTVGLLVDLTTSMPFPRTVNLLKPNGELGTRETSAPSILYFQYSIFRSLFEATAPDTVIDFSVTSDESSIRFYWSCSVDKDVELFPEMPRVAERLGVSVDLEGGEVVVTYPF